MTIEGAMPSYPGSTIAYSMKYARKVCHGSLVLALEALWIGASRVGSAIERDDKALLSTVAHRLFSDAAMANMAVIAAGRKVFGPEQETGINGAAGVVIYTAHRLLEISKSEGSRIDSALAFEHHKRLKMSADILEVISKELLAEIEANE